MARCITVRFIHVGFSSEVKVFTETDLPIVVLFFVLLELPLADEGMRHVCNQVALYRSMSLQDKVCSVTVKTNLR